jgi:hypothetical protein
MLFARPAVTVDVRPDACGGHQTGCCYFDLKALAPSCPGKRGRRVDRSVAPGRLPHTGALGDAVSYSVMPAPRTNDFAKNIVLFLLLFLYA